MADVPSVTLSNGVRMPLLGFGVYQVPADQHGKTVAQVIRPTPAFSPRASA
jgi:2,5-diketo-D-gluconate reductase A